jgi:hypothetical protein
MITQIPHAKTNTQTCENDTFASEIHTPARRFLNIFLLRHTQFFRTHAWGDFETLECDFHTYKRDFHTHECDFDTNECDFHTLVCVKITLMREFWTKILILKNQIKFKL